MKQKIAWIILWTFLLAVSALLLFGLVEIILIGGWQVVGIISATLGACALFFWALWVIDQ